MAKIVSSVRLGCSSRPAHTHTHLPSACCPPFLRLLKAQLTSSLSVIALLLGPTTITQSAERVEIIQKKEELLCYSLIAEVLLGIISNGVDFCYLHRMVHGTSGPFLSFKAFMESTQVFGKLLSSLHFLYPRILRISL